MPSIHDNDIFSTAGGSTRTTKDFTYQLGDLFLVGMIGVDGGADIQSVSSNGSFTFTERPNGLEFYSSQRTNVYIAEPLSAGVGNFTITLTESADYVDFVVLQLRGSGGPVLWDTPGGDNEYGAKLLSYSLPLTLSNGNSLVIGFVSVRINDLTPGSNYSVFSWNEPHFSTNHYVVEGSFADSGSIVFDGTFSGNTQNFVVIAHTFYEGATSNVEVFPDRIENTNSLYLPTISYDPLIALPDRIENTNSLYLPTISYDPLIVLPDRIENTNSLYLPTIEYGAITVSPDRIENTNSLYLPTISYDPLIVLPDRIENTNSLYLPAIEYGSVSVNPGRIENTNSLYLPTISYEALTVQPGRIENTNSLYLPTISYDALIISTSRIENTNSLYLPTISYDSLAVYLERIENTNILYLPVVEAFYEYTNPVLYKVERQNELHIVTKGVLFKP